jgi:hypothetical protein
MSGGRQLAAWLRTVIVIGAGGRLALGDQKPNPEFRGSEESGQQTRRCNHLFCNGIMSIVPINDQPYWICNKNSRHIKRASDS